MEGMEMGRGGGGIWIKEEGLQLSQVSLPLFYVGLMNESISFEMTLGYGNTISHVSPFNIGRNIR